VYAGYGLFVKNRAVKEQFAFLLITTQYFTVLHFKTQLFTRGNAFHSLKLGFHDYIAYVYFYSF